MVSRLVVGALVALLCLVHAAAAFAESTRKDPPGPAPSSIAPVEVVCDARECGRESFRRRLVALSGLSESAAPAEEALRRAESNLMQTGYFASVSAEWRDDHAVLDCVAATLIRDVKVRAGSALGSELRRRVFLRAGEAWTADPRLVERQRAEIVEYFEANGYFGTTVDIIATPVTDHLVDLTFAIQRGTRETVGRVYLRGIETLSYEEARDLVIGEFDLVRSFTAARFERAQRALVRAYRSRGYIQARVTHDSYRIDAEQGTVDLFVEVREGPRWDVRFTGNTLFTRAALLDAVSFYKTGFVDAAEIAIAEGEIQRLYETVGHFFAEVHSTWTTADDGTQSLVFEITERQVSEIRQIRFEGLRSVDEAALRDLLGTVEYDILSVGGYLQRARLANDIETIRAVYAAAGFLSARVTRVVLVGENDGRDLTVTLHVDEGARTDIADVVVVGAPPELDAVVRSVEQRAAAGGTAFAPQAIVDDRAALVGALHHLGYAFAGVETVCVAEGSDEEVACAAPTLDPARVASISSDRATACDRVARGASIVEECRLVAPLPGAHGMPGLEGGPVRVVHHVDPGRRVRFGTLIVQGNFATRRSVIERELHLRPGAPFDSQEVLNGQARLRSLSLFDSVRASTVGAQPDPETGEDIHVIVQVEESGSRYFDHRLGLEASASTSQGFVLILSNEPTFRELNLAGRAKELRVFGNFDFDVLNPSRLATNEFRGSFGALYLARRFYLTPRMTDPWEVQAQLAYSYDLLAVAPAPLVRELGFDGRVREESDQVRGLFFEVGLSVKRTDTVDQSDVAVASDGFERALILSLSPRVTLDRRDNALNPSRGSLASVEVELADDFVGLQDFEQFTKVTLRGSGFVPLGSGFVLGLNARAGGAVGGILSGFRSTSTLVLPVAERFSLGGVTTLRGFSEGAVSSLDTTDFGGDYVLNGNLELRYPLIRSLGVQGAMFVDVGQLAPDVDRFELAGFRATTGLGLRWLIADVLPVVLDYGVVLARRPGEGLGRLHFNVGYTF
ncbi:MAG: BamA/TamA family outer membrane protein [Myxococcales bacterium]|nr:BamA/TamA family outer membrane protein [Myxococcales bacterium]MCB9519878.1 BamA/TamA family outer membrane protein [Myxococcales bacterium]MCB9533215.1 BamA/TamA family outer membrane protein [Myxococcales bacterium]